MRQTEPRKLMAMLRGELDWVVMKCLEKQRERRYETANGLARDVQRYLADEAVEARPPSAGYRFSKFFSDTRDRFRGEPGAAGPVGWHRRGPRRVDPGHEQRSAAARRAEGEQLPSWKPWQHERAVAAQKAEAEERTRAVAKQTRQSPPRQNPRRSTSF